MATKKELIDSLDVFTCGYISAFLWAETDDNDEPLEKNYDESDFTVEALEEIIRDCADFQSDNRSLYGEHWTDGEAGHDFYLTRNGHGAGFWDRGRPNGEALRKVCKPYGTQGASVYRGKITLHG